MTGSKSENLSNFSSLDALVESFDNEDWGDYLEQMPSVSFDVELKKSRQLFTLDDELARKITEIAKLRKVSSQIRIDAWLREKIAEQAS